MSFTIDRKKLNQIRQQIQRASMGYQAQVWDNGIFEIHNVKETDFNLIMSNLNRIDEITNVSHTYRFDYGRPFFGTAPKIYTIRGNFEVPTLDSKYHE